MLILGLLVKLHDAYETRTDVRTAISIFTGDDKKPLPTALRKHFSLIHMCDVFRTWLGSFLPSHTTNNETVVVHPPPSRARILRRHP